MIDEAEALRARIAELEAKLYAKEQPEPQPEPEPKPEEQPEPQPYPAAEPGIEGRLLRIEFRLDAIERSEISAQKRLDELEENLSQRFGIMCYTQTEKN